ncbi:stage III sporulation protein AA [Bacillus oleivorans]|uniref:Stage III sporulation protein AA n=1 Tax=Bacillus oleivorans TaxID=1448271 RepID=A0A285CKA4_9BACI|nr:stage III sporulation protein AA [Bacillus oleivorans]SNX67960.1 stage III sporulation protein AA [Bacillus oleivorans]
MEPILACLPRNIQEPIMRISKSVLEEMEEIRIRVGRPIEISVQGKASFLPYQTTMEDALHFLDKLSHFSMYTLEEELKRGYITIEGGHRVGLAGKVILENGQVKAIRDVASFNIRIAKENIGIADRWVPYLYKRGKWLHTMIIGAPQSGKTTLLRDLARFISSGSSDGLIEAAKVGIVDERSEIAGCMNGIPQLQFGPRIDVLDACPKAEGMMMMIRSMSPQVLIVDEIGRTEDTIAILEAVNAGIQLIMTTHGSSYEEVLNRPALAPIMKQKMIQRFLVLSHTKKSRSLIVLDENGRQVSEKVSVT